MEAMLYRDAQMSVTATMPPIAQAPAVTTDWQAGLPQLVGAGVTLRELRPSDAPSLLATLTTEEVSRFMSPPPTTVAAFERFIAWTARQRLAGEYVCFGIVPKGGTSAVGVIQIRRCGSRWDTAEWGFAIGSSYWGSGTFAAAAQVALDFVFTDLGVHRLEARAAVANGRGAGVLRKLGAVEEAVLRQSLRLRGGYRDQMLWTLWQPSAMTCKAVWGARVH